MAQSQKDTITKNRYEFIEPRLYHVVFLNDDVTTVEFVEDILIKYFGKTRQQASDIIDIINTENRAIVGSYYYDVAETKAKIVRDKARAENFPFQVVTEEIV